MKRTQLNQQTYNQNIRNILPIIKSFNRSTKARQPINHSNRTNQLRNQPTSRYPPNHVKQLSQPAKRLCSAKGIILGFKQACQAAQNGGCLLNNLCCTLSHSQKDQWPGCVRQKPEELSFTDCALT